MHDGPLYERKGGCGMCVGERVGPGVCDKDLSLLLYTDPVYDRRVGAVAKDHLLRL